MFVIYNFLLFLALLFSPIIIFIRIFLGKEDKTRFIEKYGVFAKKNYVDGTIWIHGASIGEILSIIPIVKKFEKDKRIKRILITSSTTSSSQIFLKFKFKKTIHQFYPFDLNILTKYFISYWRPKLAIFLTRNMANMYNNLNKKKIPLVLLNAELQKNLWIGGNFFQIFQIGFLKK